MKPLGRVRRHSSISSPQPVILEHAALKLRDLLLYLKANPIGDEILDTRNLPVAKGTLINALRLLIAGETRAEQREQMQRVGILLAHFQPSVGLAVATLPQDQSNPLSFWISVVQEQTRNFSAHDTWATVLAERERLAELFRVSASVAERRGCHSVATPRDTGEPLAG